MKAVRVHEFGGPEVLRMQTEEDPRALAGQVVIRVRAIGVNPVDAYIRSGLYGPRSFPFTPGMDAAGVVETVGTGVDRFKPGERVYVHGPAIGAYAERVAVEASRTYRLPDSVSFQQGAALGVPYATAYFALFHRGHAMPGEWVLIHGASGGVGTAAVQLARARGLQVVGTGGTEAGRKLVAKEGAHHALDHHSPGYLDQAVQITGGRGFDVIVEMLANVNLGKDLKILAPQGRVVVVGSRGPVEIDPRDAMGRHADIRGMSLLNVPVETLAGVHAALGAGLENGSLRPVIGCEFPLAQAAQAHQKVMEAGACGKIVLIP